MIVESLIQQEEITPDKQTIIGNLLFTLSVVISGGGDM